MNFAYIAVLAFSLLGVGAIDFRSRIALFVYPLRTALTLAIGVAFFLIWDFTGIALGVFFVGKTEYITGLMLAPEVPIEEPLFLLLLCYCALLLYIGFSRKAAKA